MKINKEIAEIINSILDDGVNNEIGISAYSRTDENWKKAVRICIALYLIKPKDKKPTIFELTEKGIIALNEGGIENYLDNIKAEKDLTSTIKELTSERFKNDVKNNLQYIALGGIIGLVTAISTTGLTLWATPDTAKEYIDQLNKLSSEKTELYYNLQKSLNDKNTLIFELKHEIDSLKTK